MTKHAILHPTDFSAVSWRAFGKAVERAKAAGVHAIPLLVEGGEAREITRLVPCPLLTVPGRRG